MLSCVRFVCSIPTYTFVRYTIWQKVGKLNLSNQTRLFKEGGLGKGMRLSSMYTILRPEGWGWGGFFIGGIYWLQHCTKREIFFFFGHNLYAQYINVEDKKQEHSTPDFIKPVDLADNFNKTWSKK